MSDVNTQVEPTSEEQPKGQELDTQASTEEKKEDLSVEEIVANAVAEASKDWKDLFDKQKRQIAGLDKKNSLLEAEKKKIERAAMTQEQLKEAELEEYKAKAEKLERMERDSLVRQKLTDNGLPSDLVGIVNFAGTDEFEINDNVKVFADKFFGLVKEIADKEIKEKLGNRELERTQPGASDKNITREEFEKLNPSERMAKMKDGYKVVD